MDCTEELKIIINCLRNEKEIPINMGEPRRDTIKSSETGYEGLSLLYGRLTSCIKNNEKKMLVLSEENKKLLMLKSLIDDLLFNKKEWE